MVLVPIVGAVFFEIKRPDGVVSPSQMRVHQLIREQGAGRWGWPDRMVLVPTVGAVFFEIKRPNGVVSPPQMRVHKMIRELGAVVYVCRSKAEIDQQLDFLKVVSRG